MNWKWLAVPVAVLVVGVAFVASFAQDQSERINYGIVDQDVNSNPISGSYRGIEGDSLLLHVAGAGTGAVHTATIDPVGIPQDFNLGWKTESTSLNAWLTVHQMTDFGLGAASATYAACDSTIPVPIHGAAGTLWPRVFPLANWDKIVFYWTGTDTSKSMSFYWWCHTVE